MCTQMMRNHLPFPPLSTLPHSLQHQQNQLITPFFWTGSKSWTHAGDVFQALESAQTVITLRLHSFSIMHFFPVCSSGNEVVSHLKEYLFNELPLDIENVHKGAATLRHLRCALGTACQGLQGSGFHAFSINNELNVNLEWSWDALSMCCCLLKSISALSKRHVLMQWDRSDPVKPGNTGQSLWPPELLFHT